MRSVPSQPNIDFSSNLPTWSSRFWLLVIVTGIAAGLAGGALMRFLHAVEHIAWRYQGDNVLAAASVVSARHRVLTLLAAGILVGAGGRLI